MARKDVTREAVVGLATIASDAQEDEPRLVAFIQSLWELCRDKRFRGTLCKGRRLKWTLDAMPIHTHEWRRLTGATTTIGGRKAYLVYREWMMEYRFRRRPLLEQVEPGGSTPTVDPRSGVRTTQPVVGLWRINMPLCKDDPWKRVRAELPKPTSAPGFGLSQVATIRECLASASLHRSSDGAERKAQIVETAKMAAYHTLLRSGRGVVNVCPYWPGRGGVDLAVWRKASGGNPKTRAPDMLVVVGTGDARFAEVARRYDRADGEATAARIYLSVRRPKAQFAQKARLGGVHIVRVGGFVGGGLRFQSPRRQE